MTCRVTVDPFVILFDRSTPASGGHVLYMLLIYNCDRPEPQDPRFPEALARVNAFADECRRRGAFVSGHPLQGEHTATTVRVREGKTFVTDGPFPETHEHLGGTYVLDCPGLDVALELAALWPMAEDGTIEVRPIAGVPALDHRVATGV
ncbi:YciI family protein [Amycolatopsis japonica]